MNSRRGEKIDGWQEQAIIARWNVVISSSVRADESARSMANTPKGARASIEPAPYINVADTAINSIQEIDSRSPDEIDGIIYIRGVRERIDRIHAETPQDNALNNLREAA